MSRIVAAIPPRNYEVIRDQIGAILTDEIDNQFILSYDPDLEATVVTVERFVPFQIAEVPAVNVMLARGDYDNKTAIKSDGKYRYYIDCYASAESTADAGGDSLAMFKLQKIMGVCAAILDSPHYLTLGFARPFIENTHIESIEISQPNNTQDAASMVAGRIVFVVRVPESIETLVPNLIAGYDTGVRIALTDRGYVFSGDQSPIPPPTPGGIVIIKDQDGFTIAEVQAPGEYTVLVFDEIADGTPFDIPVDEVVDDVFN